MISTKRFRPIPGWGVGAAVGKIDSVADVCESLIRDTSCWRCRTPIGDLEYRLTMLQETSDPDEPGVEVSSGPRSLVFAHVTCPGL